MKVLLVAVNAKYTHMNPALYSIRAYADPEGKMTEIVEYTINQYPRDVLADIFARHPQVIGFSVYIWNRTFMEQLLREIKKILPETIVLLGGPEAENDSEKLQREFSSVDGIFFGEGEPQWKRVLELLQKCESEGITFPEMRERVSRFMKENVTDYDFSMDDLPFLYKRENMVQFQNRMLYYETSRGCPFQCSYCLSSQEKGLRFRSLDRVYEELQFFLDHGVPIVKFIDRTFNVSHDHAMGIWKYLKSHDNGMTRFHFEIEAELLTEDELDFLSTVRKGLFQFELGLQSIHEKTLKAVRRSIHVEKIFNAVRTLQAAGRIHVHLDLIAGLPYEGFEEFKESFNVAYDCGADVLQLGFLKVLPGTFMAECVDEYGICHEEIAPYEVLSTKWISYGELRKLKAVEEQLERYGNSGAFAYSIRAFRSLFNTPYELYDYLAQYYATHTEAFSKQSRISAYEMLRNSFMKRIEEKVSEKDRSLLLGAFDGALLLDLYSREKLKSRPLFIPVREESEELGAYLKNRQPSPESENDLKTRKPIMDWDDEKHHVPSAQKTVHKEVLSIWLPSYLQHGEVVPCSCVLEFMYEGSGAAKRILCSRLGQEEVIK